MKSQRLNPISPWIWNNVCSDYHPNFLQALTSCAIPRYRVPTTANDISTWVSMSPPPAMHIASTTWGTPDSMKVPASSTQRSSLVTKAAAAAGSWSVNRETWVSSDAKKQKMDRLVASQLCSMRSASATKPTEVKATVKRLFGREWPWL